VYFQHRNQEQLKSEAEDIVGDFQKTLEECRILLQKHITLDGRRASVIDNLFWGLSTQKRVEELRKRIQFHTQKIYLVIEPVQLGLIRNIDCNVNEILDLRRKHVNQAPELYLPLIPASFAGRFHDALCRNSPVPLEDAACIPLREGFDVLYDCYRHSTVSVTETNPTTVEQYLNLIKAHWLADVLKRSYAYQETRPGSLYRRMIAQVEQRVSRQYARKDISRYPEDELAGLDDSVFEIWPEIKIILPPPLTEAKGREEKLAELCLSEQAGFRKQDLVIFRVNTVVLRIVLSQTYESAIVPRQATEIFVNTSEDGLVPWYTIPKKANPAATHALEVTNGKGAGGKLYDLRSRADAFSFQRAFVGYEVASDTRDVLCTFTLSARFSTSSRIGFGEVQLWHWPTPTSTSRTGEPLSPNSSVLASPRSGGTMSTQHTAVSRITQNADPGIVSLHEGTSDSTLIAAKLPPGPILMAFTFDKIKEELTMWQIDGHYPVPSTTFFALTIYQCSA